MTLPPDLVEDRYRNRRAMAWISLAYILLVGLVLLVYGMRSTANASILQQISFVIAGVMGVPTMIVTYYFGSTLTTDLWGKK